MTSELLRFRTANARGNTVGEAHHLCKFSDALVEQARELRAAGASYREIARVYGCALGTAHAWIAGRRRRQHARVIVQRRRSSAVDVAATEPTHASPEEGDAL